MLTDYATMLSLFTHHQWIGGFFIVGAAGHPSPSKASMWQEGSLA